MLRLVDIEKSNLYRKQELNLRVFTDATYIHYHVAADNEGAAGHYNHKV